MKWKKLAVKMLLVMQLIVLMLMSCQCSKLNKSAKVVGADDFVAFLENKLGATRETVQSLFAENMTDKWNNGFYIDTDKRISLNSFAANGDLRCSSPIYDAMECLKTEIVDGEKKGAKEYDIERIIYYLKGDVNQEYTDSFWSDCYRQQLSTQKTTEELSILMHITFKDNTEALEYFKSLVDRHFNYRAKIYPSKYEENKKRVENDLLDPDYAAWKCLDPSSNVNSRKMYYLDDLPGDVYSLNESQYSGHLSYTTDDKWVSEADIMRVRDFLVNGKAPFAHINEFEQGVSYELRGNTVVILYELDKLSTLFARNYYYEDWPELPFEDSYPVVSACKEFGFVNPYDVDLEKGLKLELAYNADISGQRMHFQEVYLRRGGDTE